MAELLPKPKKRRERRHIMFAVRKAVDAVTGEVCAGLFPRFATDRRLLRERGYKIGDNLRAELSKPRILGQHRRAHLLGQLVVAQVEGFEQLDAHAAIKRLQRESGICCDTELADARPVAEAFLAAAESLLGRVAADVLRAVLPQIKMIEVRVARSLAFDAMEQGEFEAFYRGICQHLGQHYWHGCDPEQVERMAELFDKEQAA